MGYFSNVLEYREPSWYDPATATHANRRILSAKMREPLRFRTVSQKVVLIAVVCFFLIVDLSCIHRARAQLFNDDQELLMRFRAKLLAARSWGGTIMTKKVSRLGLHGRHDIDLHGDER